MPPITPPTRAPVLEVLTQGDDVDRYMGGISGNEVEAAIRTSPEGGRSPVGLAEGELELEVPITVPGLISGVSITHRCEAAKRKTEKGTPTTSGHQFVEVPSILRLACPISSCREKKIESNEP